MNGLERLLAHLEGRPVDHLPLMPVTMQDPAERQSPSSSSQVRSAAGMGHSRDTC